MNEEPLFSNIEPDPNIETEPVIAPEIEARIVALVLGEASEFETAELDRLIEQRPPLAMLRKRIEAVHDLLQDVATGESTAGDEGWDLQTWKLPDEQRSAVLAVMDNAVPSGAAASGTAPSGALPSAIETDQTLRVAELARDLTSLRGRAAAAQGSSNDSKPVWRFATLAASLCIVTAVAFSLMLPAQMHRMSSKRLASESRPASSPAGGASDGEMDKASVVDAIAGKTIAAADRDSVASLRERVEFLATDDSIPGPFRRASSPTVVQRSESVKRSRRGISDLISDAYSGADSNSDRAPESESKENMGRTLGDLSKVEIAAESVAEIRDLRELERLGDAAPSPSPSRAAGFGGEMGGGYGGGGYGAGGGGQLDVQVDDHAYVELNGRGTRESEPAVSAASPAETDEQIAAKASTAGTGLAFSAPPEQLEEARQLWKNTLARRARGASIRGRTLRADSGQRSAVNEEALRRKAGRSTADSRRQSGEAGPATLGYEFVPAFNAPAQKSAPSDRLKEQLAASTANKSFSNETTAADEAFSTFSLHVSDVSFQLAQASLARGEWPDAAQIRIEEFVNAFDYGDPMPSPSEKIACRLEQAIHPFLQQRNVLRVAMRTAAAGRSAATPLRLTLLLDNSGSMERADRHETLLRALTLLTEQLTPIDQVTLISFARQPRLLADRIGGDAARDLVKLVRHLPSEGGTNLEAALQLAFEKAQQQHVDQAQNRIILLTDGAANLGDAEPASLSRMIATMRGAGIAFDAAGIGADGLNDEILEALTRQGDGRYYLLDQPGAADEGFARQIAGALRPAAKNVKVQVEFNPLRVGRYQLLGFEKHRLQKKDFRNDQVDAAEMAAAEAGVAVYQFEPKPDGEGDVGSVSVRFRDMSTGTMVENRWPIPYEAEPPRLEQAAPAARLATVAALLAAKLRGEPVGETVDLKTLSSLIAQLPAHHRQTRRVQHLEQMIAQAREMSGKSSR